MTNEVVNAVEQAVAQAIPNAPAVQAIEAVAATAADPSPLNIAADIELALSLVAQLKAQFANSHPSIMTFVKALF
jgi:hypothetical protein